MLNNEELIKSNFAKRKKRQLILTLPFVVVVICFLILARTDTTAIAGIPKDILLPITVILMVLGLIFSFFNWRCPNCSHYLGRTFNPGFCTKCGSKLQ
jgi:hypothetical protein